MDGGRTAQVWHLATAAVGAFAQVAQLVLVIAGVSGLVTWFWLRPLLELSGWSYATDKLLHVVVPIMAVLGWLAFGPRPRISLRVVLLAVIWPVAWLAYTLLLGAATGWYPYPFVDVDARGPGPVAVA